MSFLIIRNSLLEHLKSVSGSTDSAIRKFACRDALKFFIYFPFRTYRRSCFFMYKTLHPVEITQYQDPALFGHGTSHSTDARVDQRYTGNYILSVLSFFFCQKLGSHYWFMDPDPARWLRYDQICNPFPVFLSLADPHLLLCGSGSGIKKFPYGSGS